MLCPHCHGTHFAIVNGQRLPCPDCAGMGEIHCCDGLMEQPDPTGEMVCPPPNGNGATCPANGGVARPTDDKASGGR
jgi:hypothetical protein